MTEAVMIGFLIGVFFGLLIYQLILHLEKLDWIRTRVYHYGFRDGYKKGFRDGKRGEADGC
jgi:hypothetical protein